jgi:hypothetical protein
MTANLDTLKDVALKWSTDKANNGYIEHYEKYFEPLRNEKLNILEIGVKRATQRHPHGAASHRTWKEYFPNANIYGIDIDPKTKEYEQDRLEIFIGSQGDPDVMIQAMRAAGHFDIIIDDGSHVNSLTLASFEGLFPSLKSGGLYIIEDLGVSYMDLDGPHCRARERAATNVDGATSGWFGMHLMPEDYSYKNKRSDMLAFFHDQLSRLDLGDHPRWARRLNLGRPDITQMDFYKGICFMTKV